MRALLITAAVDVAACLVLAAIVGSRLIEGAGRGFAAVIQVAVLP